ncbi:MAG: aromatic amino acid ammonia-lyase [Pacificibacter sp.]|uniref:aromatic amino acid ammonia-lyase n=1 Tax=Pacificibacter sp. TaxID=1917866 RepID=UPI003218FB11
MKALRLDGSNLTVGVLARAACGEYQVELSDTGLERMRRARALVDRVIEQRVPVYGVTTGLGARSSEALDAHTLQEFSIQTLRGRAQAMGSKAPREIVRAAMIVRANTMLTGYSGARPQVALHLAACLNANLTPVVGEVGSIGAADLVQNATLGLALIGEGEMQDASGEIGPSADKMRAYGITPLTLGPKDGLALANHTGFSSGAAALACHAAEVAFEVAQTAASLSLEAFRANLTPFKHSVLAAKPLPGQSLVAAGLRARLEGSLLWDEKHARRLQDPLSYRNICQIHGATASALEQARLVVEIEANGSSDNPIALIESDEIISCGNYYTAELGQGIEGISRAIASQAMAQLSRMSKLLHPDFSGLPAFLAQENSGSNGFAPVMKTAEAWLAKLVHAAQPVPIWPSINANGVEDCLPNSPQSISALSTAVECMRHMNALELLIAAQAIELRACQVEMAPFVQGTFAMVRTHAKALTIDRSFGCDVDGLVQVMRAGASSALFPVCAMSRK